VASANHWRALSGLDSTPLADGCVLGPLDVLDDRRQRRGQSLQSESYDFRFADPLYNIG